ncbi:hypothetical protein [Tsukamurella tyrosinosolvens]|uniref:hypothetical protein n=1 Tax=Tsukamurella tyrosinosolvens TaxID=57704 RepID=UPI000DF6E975|nr:hypothetical protein [Tsukamurella tyrosinosolvens]RDB49101.1 hypothetical protein DVB87_04790 [Tsukamurella tyrosinosolvens]
MSTLDRLVGTWSFTMQHVAMTVPVLGTQTYRWTLGGAFVEQDWTYEHPDFPDAIAMLDERHLHYFDVRGVVRVFDLTLDDSGWAMIRRDDDFWQRSTGRFIGNDTIEGSGELSYDEGVNWQHDYSIECRRAR